MSNSNSWSCVVKKWIIVILVLVIIVHDNNSLNRVLCLYLLGRWHVTLDRKEKFL